jgi:hypothetical protein
LTLICAFDELPGEFMPESGEALGWDATLVLRSAVQWVLV